MMRITDIGEKIQAFFLDKKMKAPVILGLAGIALIVISGNFSEKDKKPQEAPSEVLSVSYAQDYARDAEERLREILSSIEGVGKAEIMVSVECSEEMIYAEDSSVSKENDESRLSSQQKSEHVIIRSGNENEALLKKVVSPRLSGVLVACEGGDKAAVRDAVTRSVSALFGISSAKIYVAELEKQNIK